MRSILSIRATPACCEGWVHEIKAKLATSTTSPLDDLRDGERYGLVLLLGPERHEYELYLAVEDIDHSRTKTKSLQTTRCVWCSASQKT